MPQHSKITSWSFSRWSAYEECPFKASLKFLKKLPEPGSPAMDRGNEVHKALEQYLKGITMRLHKNWKAFGPMLKAIRVRRKQDPQSVLLEETFAFRSDWTETVYNDWDGCWLRIKVDCAIIRGDADNVEVAIHDWKTGRYRDADTEKYALQLDLYALGALLKYQDAKSITVTPALVYIDEGVTHCPRTYTKADLPRLKKEWIARSKPMLKDSKFLPKPNFRCRYCHYRASNGGPCKEN